jgi:two-component system, LytTR family, sensor kinase
MKITNHYKEILFQIIVHIIVFLFYALDRNADTIPSYKFAYFLNYAFSAALINYVAIPFFYKKKNTLLFILVVAFFILIPVLIEELVLEKIFFPGPRAESIKVIWAFISIIPIVSILTGIKLGWDAINKNKEVERLEDVIKESELQFLKSQINPHFLFNNLNNLYSYALEGSSKTPDIILELSGLLRYMLYECKEKYVPLSKELSQIGNFINLNELQIEDRGNVSLKINSINGSYNIAPLILIVFIENAFKHSQSSQSDKININVEIDCDDNGQLHFQCSNNYKALSNTDKLDKGIGLTNVKKRLNLIYPNRHKLNIKSDDTQYEVSLQIDLSDKL